MTMKKILCIALLAMISTVAQAQVCNGLVPGIIGTEGDDDIDGTEGDDVIAGLGGNDRIRGLGGNDVYLRRRRQ